MYKLTDQMRALSNKIHYSELQGQEETVTTEWVIYKEHHSEFANTL